MRTKLSERLHFYVTHEMLQWLKEIGAESGKSPSTIARSMLQTIMDEDQRDEAADEICPQAIIGPL